jgi:hypothetical protein
MTLPFLRDRVVSEALEHPQGTDATAACVARFRVEPVSIADLSPVAQDRKLTFSTARAGEPADVSGFCGGSAYEY